MFVTEIRRKLQTQLDINKLVEKVDSPEISILETGKNAKLKKLTITHLPYEGNEKNKIWRINLEQEVKGLSTANKTGELALAVLKNNYLNVYIIELKSAIKDPTLKAIQGKVEHSISRFYFLLSLNSDKDHEIVKNLKIRFIALVFFDGHDKTTNTTDPDFENIYRIFRKRGGQLECQTILDNNLRIPVKFFSEGFDKVACSMKMNFSDIENEIKKIRGRI
ncbi:MAG: hypothetical protein VSS75_022245 [Candidatus Parabeggiatoa sp.]|nr:hypothetical protein [Candidatus Parabeggiatoa sp.]